MNTLMVIFLLQNKVMTNKVSNVQIISGVRNSNINFCYHFKSAVERSSLFLKMIQFQK